MSLRRATGGGRGGAAPGVLLALALGVVPARAAAQSPTPEARPGVCIAPPLGDARSLVAAGRYWHASRVVAPLPKPPHSLDPSAALLQLRIAEGLGFTLPVDEILARVRGADTVAELLAIAAQQDERTGRWAAAAARYRRLAARADAGPAFEVTAAVRLALVWEKSGQRDSAMAAWRMAAQVAPEVADWFALRRAELEEDTALAFASVQDARTPGAAERADALVASARERAGNFAGALELFLRRGRPLDAARVEASLGRWKPARRRVDSLLFTDPTQPVALLAANLLVERFGTLTPQELIGIAAAFRARGDRAAAERYARRAVARRDTSPAARIELATILAARRQFQAALLTLDSADAVRHRRKEPEAPAIARARVLVLGAADRWEDADSVAMRLARAAAGDSDAAAALLLVAGHERLRGSPEKERALYLELLLHFTATAPALAARYRLALADAAAGRLDSARAGMAAVLAEDSAHRLGLAPRYWVARLGFEHGDSLAAAQLAALATDAPTGYYGVRAREMLGDSLPLAPDTVPPPAPDAFPATRARERIELLARVGLEEEARAEAAGWLKDPHASVAVLLAAAGAAAEAGYAREAIQLSEAARKRVGLSLPVALGLFPLPYRPVIEAEALEQCVDPLLMAAIIRQESRFEPAAQSRAGARGLSQVLPRTGAELARLLRLGPWNPRFLFVPDFNLHLGARYVHDRLVRDSLPVYALLASYDAGRTAVLRERQRPEFRDPDLFVERLPVAETRDYVRRVYAGYRWYRRLYGAGDR
ncbi:MAG TPA: lytic transglycosylase domain-containing protein [Gemmatimonadales bacterium]|nr:lytic transglycosylase domain-containing protein [Gemmatimonadales bacterium]